MSKKWWNSLSLEQQQEYNHLRRERYQKKISQMSAEQLVEHKRKQREGWEAFAHNLTIEQKEQLHKIITANRRNEWASVPSEIKEQRKKAMSQRGQIVRAKQKYVVINHYSNGTMKCARCYFSDIRALSIDHINGGGRKQEKELRKIGTILYRWLPKNNFPEGYQVLCLNCQFIKRLENKECCLHKD